jgi:hypothetical protein
MDNLSSSNENTNALNTRTTTDLQLESTERLYETANRIDNIITELGSNANILDDKETSQRTKSDAARVIRKCIIPALEKVGCILKDATKSLAPIGSVKVISDRNGRKRKKNVVDTDNKRKSAELQPLDSYNSIQRDPPRPKLIYLSTSTKERN